VLVQGSCLSIAYNNITVHILLTLSEVQIFLIVYKLHEEVLFTNNVLLHPSYAIFTTDKTQYLHLANVSWSSDRRCMKKPVDNAWYPWCLCSICDRIGSCYITYAHPILINQTTLFNIVIYFKLSTAISQQNNLCSRELLNTATWSFGGEAFLEWLDCNCNCNFIHSP